MNSIVSAHSGATSEAITYPACGGQSSCGGVSYANSVSQGTTAVINAVSAFAKSCPSTELVLVGYSQVRVPLLEELHPPPLFFFFCFLSFVLVLSFSWIIYVAQY